MANQSASGPTWSFTTASSQSPPSTPSALSATAISQNQINLSWSNVANETGYRVERSPDGSTAWTEIANLAADVISYSDQQVASQHTYYYRARAFNTGGFSGYTNVVSATTPAAPPPAASDVVLWASEAQSRLDVGRRSAITVRLAAIISSIRMRDLPKIIAPAANPPDYFEMTFTAQAGRDYRLWMRGERKTISGETIRGLFNSPTRLIAPGVLFFALVRQMRPR